HAVEGPDLGLAPAVDLDRVEGGGGGWPCGRVAVRGVRRCFEEEGHEVLRFVGLDRWLRPGPTVRPPPPPGRRPPVAFAIRRPVRSRAVRPCPRSHRRPTGTSTTYTSGRTRDPPRGRCGGGPPVLRWRGGRRTVDRAHRRMGTVA